MQRLERLEQLQMERENQAKQPRATVQAEPAAQRVEARSNAALAESVVTAELGSEGADSSFVNMRLQPAKFTWASALQRHSERGEHVPEKCSRKAMRGAGPAKHEPNNTLSTSAWDMSRLARESSDFEDCGLSLACFPNMPQRPSLRLCLFLRQTLVFCLPACLPASACCLTLPRVLVILPVAVTRPQLKHIRAQTKECARVCAFPPSHVITYTVCIPVTIPSNMSSAETVDPDAEEKMRREQDAQMAAMMELKAQRRAPRMAHSGQPLHRHPRAGGDAGQQGPKHPGLVQIIASPPDYAESSARSGGNVTARQTEQAPATAEEVAACSADAQRHGKTACDVRVGKYRLPRRPSFAAGPGPLG